MKTRVYLVATLAVVAAVSLPVAGSASLLVEGGFENNNLASLPGIVTPLTPALWGYEQATNVNSGGSGILPRTGRWMHAMPSAGGTWNQSMQFVNITGVPFLQASAYYNSNAPSALATLILLYYPNASSWGSPMAQSQTNLTLDGNPGTWEQIAYTSAVPSGANWVAFQVAFSNATTGPDYTGYVDDASLTPVPEPGSLLAVGSGLAAVAGMWRRRRK